MVINISVRSITGNFTRQEETRLKKGTCEQWVAGGEIKGRGLNEKFI